MSTVIVKSGDSLYKILRDKGLSANQVDEFVALNSEKYPSLLENKGHIEVGWELKLPGSTAPEPTKTTTATPDEIKDTSPLLLKQVKALPPEDRKTIQRMLVRAGYNTNGIEGIIGKASRKALKDWSDDNPDLKTLSAEELVTRTEEIIKAEAKEFEDKFSTSKLPTAPEDFNNAAAIKLGPDVSNDAVARDLQSDLKALGFYKLRIDGVFGPGSRQAVKDWQKANGFEQTGELTVYQAGQIKDQAETKRAEIENSATYQPNDTSRWTMTAQMTGSETSPEGNMVSLGILTLKAPNGTTHKFDFKSGGFGRYGDESMLPGLSSDLMSAWDNVNAAYPIDWRSFVANTKNIRHDMSGESGIGSWLRLGSDRAQTSRGAVIGQNSSGFFGIHTDGPSSPSGHYDDGSKGCITLADTASQKLFAMLEKIPASQRPTELLVLPQVTETRLAHKTDQQPRPS